MQITLEIVCRIEEKTIDDIMDILKNEDTIVMLADNYTCNDTIRFGSILLKFPSNYFTINEENILKFDTSNKIYINKNPPNPNVDWESFVKYMVNEAGSITMQCHNDINNFNKTYFFIPLSENDIRNLQFEIMDEKERMIEKINVELEGIDKLILKD